eukprot:scaffold132_cov170-Amphora_coffeaeformis.AAC.39
MMPVAIFLADESRPKSIPRSRLSPKKHSCCPARGLVCDLCSAKLRVRQKAKCLIRSVFERKFQWGEKTRR